MIFNNLNALKIIPVDFHDGVKIWWDGATRAYIDAPTSYRGKTQGLCGTFNSNMQDDFLTPEGKFYLIFSHSLKCFFYNYYS